MRVFKIWVREKCSSWVGSQKVEGWVYGGSNHSEEEARQDLKVRWQAVLQRVRKGIRASRDYEVDIREEILNELEDGAVVTRNRYGAEILNCSTTVFVDIDAPRWTLWDLLRFHFKPTPMEKLERVKKHLSQLIQKGQFGLKGARIYQTAAGIRLILNTVESDAQSPVIQRLMAKLNADWLYRTLCQKQHCFRARLTPKPSRIPLRSLQQSWPLDSVDQIEARKSWVEAYDQACQPFATCSFFEEVGEPPRSPVIDFHDQACRTGTQLPLR